MTDNEFVQAFESIRNSEAIAAALGFVGISGSYAEKISGLYEDFLKHMSKSVLFFLEQHEFENYDYVAYAMVYRLANEFSAKLFITHSPEDVFEQAMDALRKEVKKEGRKLCVVDEKIRMRTR